MPKQELHVYSAVTDVTLSPLQEYDVFRLYGEGTAKYMNINIEAVAASLSVQPDIVVVFMVDNQKLCDDLLTTLYFQGNEFLKVTRYDNVLGRYTIEMIRSIDFSQLDLLLYNRTSASFTLKRRKIMYHGKDVLVGLEQRARPKKEKESATNAEKEKEKQA